MEEIEHSIRRCEELLTISPLTLSAGGNTGGSCSLRTDDNRHMNPVDCMRASFDLLKMEFDEEYSHEIDWKRNMDLLLCGNQGMNLLEENYQPGETRKGTVLDVCDGNDELQIDGGNPEFVSPQKMFRLNGYKAFQEMEMSGNSSLSRSSSTRNSYHQKTLQVNPDSFFPPEILSPGDHATVTSDQKLPYDTPQRIVSNGITSVIENTAVEDNLVNRLIPCQDSHSDTPRSAQPRGKAYESESAASVDNFLDRLSSVQEGYPGNNRNESPRGMASMPEMVSFEDKLSNGLSFAEEGHHSTPRRTSSREATYMTKNPVSEYNIPARFAPGEEGHHGVLVRPFSKGTCISESTASEDSFSHRSSPHPEAHLSTLRGSPCRGTLHLSDKTASEDYSFLEVYPGQEGDYGTPRRELSKGAACLSEHTVYQDNLLGNSCEVHNDDHSFHVSSNSKKYNQGAHIEGKSSDEESHLGETVLSPHSAPCLSPDHSIAKWEEEMAGIKSGVLYPDYTRTKAAGFLQQESQQRIIPSNLRSNCFQEIWLEEQQESSTAGALETIGLEGCLEISGRMTASDFGKTNSRCSNPMMEPNNNQDARSKSVPKERQQDYKTKNYQRSKSATKEHCKPTICRKANSESAHSTPIIDRIKEMQQRHEYRKRARKVYEKEELDRCSFWPRINWQSQLSENDNYQPIEHRFQELQKKKIEKLASARLRKEVWLTFKPEINARSARLFKQKGLESVDVADRLTSMQHSSHKDCKQEAEKGKVTFTPEINKNTDEIISASRQFGGCSVGFLERQQYHLQAVEEKKKSKGHKAQSALTFRPNIGNSPMLWKRSSSQGVFCEENIDRFERLAYRDKERQVHAREKAAEQYYSQFNFKPEIDKVSRFLASSTSAQNLYKIRNGKKTKEALEQAAKEEFRQKHPFHPKVSSSRIGNIGHMRSIISQKQQTCKERKKLENEARICKELIDIKECTFKPYVNLTFPKDEGPVVVKGMTRHLELQNIAKQMKKDQEEWEHKVFFSHVHPHIFSL